MKDNCIWQPGSINGDEFYTLPGVARQIVSNLVEQPLTAWLPFNDTHSAWQPALEEYGYTGIATDGDFFTTDPPKECNCIISNPPFSRKNEVMERTKRLGLPFVYILPFTWLNDSIPLEYGHQLMLFRHRMHFDRPGGVKSKPRANCFALSNCLLRQDLTVIWEKGY